MINKYEAYRRWEKNSNGTYHFNCCTAPWIQCSDCPFKGEPRGCTDTTGRVPTWNDVRKLMQEVYGCE